MPNLSSPELQKEFKQYKFSLIREFINTLLPPPLFHYQFFTIKTADNISMQVWGNSAEEIITQLHRFAKLEFYL